MQHALDLQTQKTLLPDRECEVWGNTQEKEHVRECKGAGPPTKTQLVCLQAENEFLVRGLKTTGS